jgi:polyvinyl alcohol dehydrogenase (cytochrome)
MVLEVGSVGWRASLAAILALAFPVAALAADPAPPDGAALYKQRCAACHDSPDASSRAPPKAALAARAPNDIFEVLAHGVMAPMAAGLHDADLDAIALYLTGKPPTHAAAAPTDLDAAAACKTTPPPGVGGPRWNGWSPTLDNARFQADGGLSARDVPRLKVKWAFQFVGGVASQPTVVGGRVYFGAGSGRVYALDARTGCIYWRAEVAKAGVRAAVSVGSTAGPSGGAGRLAVFVGDRSGSVHALDAANGHEIWAVKLETHPFAMITGSPVLYRGRLYVPMSSSEEIVSLVKGYSCCTFRGNVVALDASTGKTLWRTYAIADAPKPYRTTASGAQMLGPAGAAIWSAPTIDARRGVLYVATGDSYTDAPNTGSDAVIAMDLVTGQVRWTHQVTANDNYLVGCFGQPGQPAACPKPVGPDHDFGASPVLRELPDGRVIVMAGQKSGEVTALDPDHQGAELWRTRLSAGSALGGVEWGLAADRDLLYAPIADPYTPKAQRKSGMYALKMGDGRVVWSTPAPDPNCAIAPKGSQINICTNGLSAAPTAIGGLVIEGSLDGILRAYDARDGKVAWSFDVGQTSFQPVNAAAPVKGDTMNAAGATVAGGMLLQISGYQAFNPKSTSLLLAFTVDGK